MQWGPSSVKPHSFAPSDVLVTDTVLGHGNFGVVALATCQGQRVAVKTVLAADDTALVQLLVEARLLASMRHAHVVTLVGVQERFLPVQLVLEYCELGDLRTFLRDGHAARLACGLSVAKADMVCQVAAGVVFLHSRLCVHRDLAARNVLVTARGGAGMPCWVVLKLADLGMTRTLRTDIDYYKVCVVSGREERWESAWRGQRSTKGGNGWYTQPQTWPSTQSTSNDAVPIRWQCPVAVTARAYTAKSDVYSFGVLVWEIYSNGATPYSELAASEVVRALCAGHRLTRPSTDTPEPVVALIRLCTVVEVSERPAMVEVMRRAELLRGGRNPTREPAVGALVLNAGFDQAEDEETCL